MRPELRVISGDGEPAEPGPLASGERLRVFRNMTASMMSDAMGVWSEIYGQFEGQVTLGGKVTAKPGEGFAPGCGWPEFLEKLWLLQHYLDHMKRICEGRA